MAKVSQREFVECVRRSQLLDEDAIRAALQGIKQGNGGQLPDSATGLAQAFVDRQLLTPWQTTKLLAKRYKGFVLGKYRLLDHLGRGGMSSVYLAEHVHMQRQVAIKVLPSNLMENKSYLQRFYREAQAAAALDHPNIVRAYDIDCVDTNHFIVMEYVRGSDLQQHIQDAGQPLDVGLAAYYIVQAANGLRHAHDAGMIHRDIKPANLLIMKNHQLKILDMGLALFADDEKASLTVANEEKLLGTADYLSPEQALDSHQVDLRTDIYSLGCTLYFALSGHAPFPEGTIAQRIAQHQSAEPAPLMNLRIDCPPDLAAICYRMMRKNPADRFQSCTEIAKELHTWLSRSGSSWASKARVPKPNVAKTDGLDSQMLRELPQSEPTTGSGGFPNIVTETRTDRSRKTKKPDNKSNPGDATATPLAGPAVAEELPVAMPIAETDTAQATLGASSDDSPNTPQVRETVSAEEFVAANSAREESQTLMESRRGRGKRTRKPPVLLWVFLGLLTLIAIGMAITFVMANR